MRMIVIYPELVKEVKGILLKYATVTLLFIYALFIVLLLLSEDSTKSVDPAGSNDKAMATINHDALEEPKQIKPNDNGWEINFSEYADGELPKENWNFEVGNKVAAYNDELQTYTNRTENVRIEDGVLVLEARPEKKNGRNYTSARINSKDKLNFEYGTLEVEAALPRGTGTWPAVWLMPQDPIYKPENFGITEKDAYYWAVNGEIDFVESIGRLPGQNIPAAHSYNTFKESPQYTPVYIDNPYDNYHRYGIVKTPDTITFTFDGEPYASRQKLNDDPLDWPYNQPYYLIINLAIGGKWAGDSGVDDATAPWLLKVKSITYKPL